MSCDVGEVTEISSAHSPTFLSLHLRHNSLSNPSVALPTLQLIFQSFRCFNLRHSSFSNPFFRFCYVTSSSLNSPDEPPMPRWRGHALISGRKRRRRPKNVENTRSINSISTYLYCISMMYCFYNIHLSEFKHLEWAGVST